MGDLNVEFTMSRLLARKRQLPIPFIPHRHCE
jgi:hypothetical protein